MTKQEYQLHIDAGLQDVGVEADGQVMWMGSKKEWAKLDELWNEYIQDKRLGCFRCEDIGAVEKDGKTLPCPYCSWPPVKI